MYFCASHVCLAPLKAGRGHQVPWNWNDRWLGAAMWLLGIRQDPLQEQQVFLTFEPCLQPHAQQDSGVWFPILILPEDSCAHCLVHSSLGASLRCYIHSFSISHPTWPRLTWGKCITDIEFWGKKSLPELCCTSLLILFPCQKRKESLICNRREAVLLDRAYAVDWISSSIIPWEFPSCLNKIRVSICVNCNPKAGGAQICPQISIS